MRTETEDRYLLWKGSEPILLASRSEARRKLLSDAGIPCEAISSDVDEEQLRASPAFANLGPDAVAQNLARAKALALSAQRPGRLVLAGDQTLSVDQETLSKAADHQEAREQLLMLRGRWHGLHSAICFAHNGTIQFASTGEARLKMREFSDRFLDRYMDAMGPAVSSTVGCYFFEGLGAHLFEEYEGDYSTILGLPLRPVLQYLRDRDLILA